MLVRRPACMSKPLSLDIRERVVGAVDGGMSRRKAAKRFGVSVSVTGRRSDLARIEHLVHMTTAAMAVG
jgi:hypothetical protein